MELVTIQQKNEFLSAFSEVIKEFAAAHNCVLKTFGFPVKFIDPLTSPETLFLVQFYNQVANSNNDTIINLHDLMEQHLKRHGLFGINSAEIDRNLLMFFSRYELVKVEKNLASNAENVNANRHNLNKIYEELDNGYFLKSPLFRLTLHAGWNKDSDHVFQLASDKQLNTILSDTIKFITPKFGEKNCFDFEKRRTTYQGKAALTGASSIGSGIIGAASFLAAGGMLGGSIIGLGLLNCMAICTLGPLAALVFVGTVMMAAIASVIITAVGAFGVYSLEKANQQRKLAGAMFSIAHAKEPAYKTDDSRLTPAYQP